MSIPNIVETQEYDGHYVIKKQYDDQITFEIPVSNESESANKDLIINDNDSDIFIGSDEELDIIRDQIENDEIDSGDMIMTST